MENEITKPKILINKILPITVILSIFSQASMLLYYNEFDFSPATYFEPYEIIISAMRDLVIVTIFMVLFLQANLLYLIPYRNKKKEKRERELIILQSRQPTITAANNNKSKRLFPSPFVFYGFLLLLTMIPPLIFKFLGHPVSFMIVLSALFALTFINVYNEFNYRRAEREEFKYSKTLPIYYPKVDSLIATITIGILMYVGLMAFAKARSVKKYNPYYKSMLILESNEVIRCTSKVLIIGKSKNYYFFYNTPDSSVRVVKRDQIKKEVIRMNNKSSALFMH